MHFVKASSSREKCRGRDRDRDRDRLYYDSSIRGYSVVIYNNKIICIKNFIKVGICMGY